MPERQSLNGSCHCGAVHVELRTRRCADAFVPRACDCSFCRKHGAAWVSDADGEIILSGLAASGLYRQGAELAAFRFCMNCGVLVAVVYADAEGERAALNARCMADQQAFAADQPASPQQLSAAEKVARWKNLWARLQCQ